MHANAQNFYAAWREGRRTANRLHDGDGGPPEKLLQTIWQHQRLRRDQLKTVDGRTVRVLHPGFISFTGGPDFRGAILQIGDGPALAGDVEVDLEPGGWRAHGHDRNANFQGVILQVVWAAGKIQETRRPVMALRDVLDAPLAELDRALENESGLPALRIGDKGKPRSFESGKNGEWLWFGRFGISCSETPKDAETEAQTIDLGTDLKQGGCL